MTERTFAYPKKVWVAVREYLKERYPEYEDCLTVHSLAAWSLWYGPVSLEEQRSEFADYPGDLQAVAWIEQRLEELGAPKAVYWCEDTGDIEREEPSEVLEVCSVCDGRGCTDCNLEGEVPVTDSRYLEVEVLACVCCQQVLENLR